MGQSELRQPSFSLALVIEKSFWNETVRATSFFLHFSSKWYFETFFEMGQSELGQALFFNNAPGGILKNFWDGTVQITKWNHIHFMLWKDTLRLDFHYQFYQKLKLGMITTVISHCAEYKQISYRIFVKNLVLSSLDFSRTSAKAFARIWSRDFKARPVLNSARWEITALITQY